MIDTTQTETLTCGSGAEDKGWEFHLRAFSHFQVDPGVMCIKRFRLVTRSSALRGANQKSSRFCPAEQRPPCSGGICRPCPGFPSAGGRPISYCLRCQGRMASLVCVSGLPRNNARWQKWTETANGSSVPKSPCASPAQGLEATCRPERLLLHQAFLCSRWNPEGHQQGASPRIQSRWNFCHIR